MSWLDETNPPKKIDYWPVNKILAWSIANLDNADPALRNVAEVKLDQMGTRFAGEE